ncbi:YdcH family protein [Stenotrophomonas sp. NPDC077464]|uniref:YdcH family protein n=1 Tax=unclassified Stenotrophomonas TaxID=196198 RepID=UPI0037D93A72
MFEGQPQSEIDARRQRDPEFKALYERHQKLNKKCMDAELGVIPIDSYTLGQMKREKLLAKQRLLRLYESSSPAH